MKNLSDKTLFGILVSTWLLLNLCGGILIKYTGIYHENIKLVAGIFIVLIGTWGARAVVSMLIGQKFQLSYAYPFLGLNYAFSVIVGVLLFQEKFNWLRFVGCIIIVCGIAVLMLSKNKEEKNKS